MDDSNPTFFICSLIAIASLHLVLQLGVWVRKCFKNKVIVYNWEAVIRNLPWAFLICILSYYFNLFLSFQSTT